MFEIETVFLGHLSLCGLKIVDKIDNGVELYYSAVS